MVPLVEPLLMDPPVPVSVVVVPLAAFVPVDIAEPAVPGLVVLEGPWPFMVPLVAPLDMESPPVEP
jgi:hypothetical protein